MKIAFLGWEFPPKISGGLGRHCYHLARALSKRGHDITFFLPSFNAPKRKMAGRVKIVSVMAGDVDSYNENLSNKRLDNFDIVHGHDWLTINALLSQNPPKVLTIHSTEFDRSGGRLYKSSRIFELERKGVREADAVITVSKKMARHVKQLCETDRKLNVIYNGVPKFKPAGAAKRNTLLFVGRLTEQKGVEYLLFAFKDVLKKVPSARLWLVGQGQLAPRLKHFAGLIGIEKKVRFFGRVSEKKLAALYSQATLVAMPSLREPFGIVALEALSYGKPLVLSKDAGVAELLHNGKSALLTEPTDTIRFSRELVKLLSNRPLRKKLSKNGKQLADTLSWEKAAGETERLYSSLLEKH